MRRFHVVLALTAILALLISLGSCGNDMVQRMESKGTALGRMNKIAVIADKELWESAVGDTFRFYYESAFPILPQPEPLFDLRHFTPNDLKVQPLRKNLRTYIVLADLSDKESETTQLVTEDIGSEKFEYASESADEVFNSVGKDKWSRGQLLVYLYAKDRATLASNIPKNFSAIAQRINKHDKKQLQAQLYVAQTNLGLSEKVKKRYGIDLEVPGDFVAATDDVTNNVLWLRKDTKKSILSVVFQSVPYENQNQLSKDSIIAVRNHFGKTYITSDTEDDVMVVHTKRLPIYEYGFSMSGNYGKELRGVWEMTKSFTGGPFITYAILDEVRQRVVYIDAFILGPGAKKRDLMMQLDHMIKTSGVRLKLKGRDKTSRPK